MGVEAVGVQALVQELWVGWLSLVHEAWGFWVWVWGFKGFKGFKGFGLKDFGGLVLLRCRVLAVGLAA